MAVTCALVQMQFGRDVSDNVQRGAELIKHAAAQGAEVICLPELATSIYFPFEVDARWLELAEPQDGPSVAIIARAAREANAYVIYPYFERAQAGELYNTAVVLDRRGSVVGSYRKMSIPLVHSRWMSGFEKYYFRPGNLGYPVFPTDTGLTIGVTICYDRHFPEGPRSLALAGADIVFVPTATASAPETWELELQAHAVANCMWAAGVNRVGVDRDGGPTAFFGRSFFADPAGRVVAQASEQQEETLLFEVDPALIAEYRNEWGFFRDRRPDAYGALVRP